jgi:capsular polysaccharide biosynthesis protein
VARWWLILPLALLGAGAGYAASLQLRPVYEATTSVLVGEIFEDPNLTKDYVESTQSLTATYADLVRRQPVLEQVVNDLGLRASWPQLRDRVRVQLPPSNPQLIAITAEADSPRDAELIAGALADALIASSPTNSNEANALDVKGFIQSRLEILQRDIARGQRTLDRLQLRYAAAPPEGKRELGDRIEEQQRLIVDWQSNYSALLSVLASEESPNTLRILETPSFSSVPIRPNIPLNTALAAATATLLAMGIAYALEFRYHTFLRSRVATAPASVDEHLGSRKAEFQSASHHE